MCGIAGIILKRGRPEADCLERAAAALGHRGPDDSGVYLRGSVGLAHTRLSIIDLAGGHQPIVDPQGRYALIANGEIYNFVELRQALAEDGCRFATGSDSETILHVYDRLGAAGFARLHGMFACALHDTRDGSLILGRDRLGIKPLYYARLPDRLAFASELKALLPLLPSMPALCPEAVARFLAVGFASGEQTVLSGVQRLEPGTVLSVDADLGLRTLRYWSAADIRPRRCSMDEAQEELGPLFDRVLTEHMRSDVPYGLFLSGGADSGILLAHLTRLGRAPIQTYSVGQPTGDGSDELCDAHRIARHFGSRHTQLHLTREQLLRTLPLAVWAADDLLFDPACLPTALLAQRAAQDLKVVFTGEGGDEVFGGYGRYRRAWVRRLVLNRGLFGARYRRTDHWRPGESGSGLAASLAAAMKTFDRPFADAWREPPRRWGYLRRAQYTDLRTELADDLLVKADRMLMAFGLEGRVPYLDHRIVEFGLSLPDRLKVQGRVGKILLRRWAMPDLPSGYLERKKRGFGVAIGPALQGAFLDRLAARLKASPLIREWLREETVAALVARQHASRDATRELLCLLQMALWHRMLIERPGERPGPDEDPLDWT